MVIMRIMMPTVLSLCGRPLTHSASRNHNNPATIIILILQIRTKALRNSATAHGHPADRCDSGTPPRGLSGSSGDPRTPLSPLPVERPFPDPFSAPRPVAGSFLRSPPPLLGSSQARGPGRQLPVVPASAAAATAPLTPIAEQDARRSQGRSHVCAD